MLRVCFALLLLLFFSGLAAFAAVVPPWESARTTNSQGRVIRSVIRPTRNSSLCFLVTETPRGRVLSRKRIGKRVFPRFLHTSANGDIYMAGESPADGTLYKQPMGTGTAYFNGFAARLTARSKVVWAKELRSSETFVWGASLDAQTNLF